MGAQAEQGPIPTAAIMGAGALVLFTVLAVGVGRVGGVGLSHMPDSPVTASVSLAVADRADGAILVEDAATHRLIETIEPGKENFMRATLRGFAQARLRAGYGREQPFVLTSYANGSLALSDETTGRRVNLEAFGPDNAGAFARLLPEGSLAR